ncbi:MAG: hypothetical protein RSE41_00615 [Clostridia bacterium]|jgi:hypothetical protein|nr:hypothetical protein [Clostridiaceae bacterium]
MSIEEIKRILEISDKVVFKLYSLIYTISKKENKYYISSDIHDGHINVFNSIDELLDKYLIYGESIRLNENRIIIQK